MYKLNIVQNPRVEDIAISKELALDILKTNDEYLSYENSFCARYSFKSLNTFSFSKEGFLSILLSLKDSGNIAISLGECEALIQAADEFKSLGFDIDFIPLNKDGSVNLEIIEDIKCDILFASSYVMDTFVKTSLEEIKSKKDDLVIISNGTFDVSTSSAVVYFDPFKLASFSNSGVLLHNELFEEQAIGFKDSIAVKLIFEALINQKFDFSSKKLFKKILEEVFKDDMYFFVDSNSTFDFTLHIAFKNIKARELIRTLSLDEIYITNGEGCSLGLSRPSRIIQAMGYDELTSRNAISLSFDKSYDEQTIIKIVNKIYKKYKQIRVLNG